MEDQVLSTKKQNLHLRENLESNISQHHHEFTMSSPRSDSLEIYTSERPDSLDERPTSSVRKHIAPYLTIEDVKKTEDRYNETIRHLKNQIEVLKKSLQMQKSAQSNYVLEKGELEDFFIQCIEEVKKDIARRKNTNLGKSRLPITASSKSLRSAKSIDPEDVKIEHFKDFDKRKVLEKLLSSDEVLALFHERIFPQTKERPSTNMSIKRIKPSQSSASLVNSHGLSSHVFSIPGFSDKKSGLVRPSTAPRDWYKQ